MRQSSIGIDEGKTGNIRQKWLDNEAVQVRMSRVSGNVQDEKSDIDQKSQYILEESQVVAEYQIRPLTEEG